MIATTARPVLLDARLPAVWAAPVVTRASVSSWNGIRAAFADGASLLFVVLAIPVAVVAVGTPVALTIVGLVGLGQWALNAL